MQIIIVCECKSKSKSDYHYIKATIDKNYDLRGKNIKLSPIYLEGKGDWNKKERRINYYRCKYKSTGETKVVFCLDYDDPKKTKNNIAKNKEIEKYCRQKDYELVWFNGNIEQVFLGRDIKKSEKVKEAEKFLSSRQIETLDMNKLSINKITLETKGSNLFVILNKLIGHTKRKN
ncbi:MAG: hypothetical protein RBR48_06230 [Bacilli bacterium]|jgi:hypothetical protein|nr:hypothetical protein [Bacilli bacterium]MDY0209754.1 hypothetical protein [Bacilli bacterium]